MTQTGVINDVMDGDARVPVRVALGPQSAVIDMLNNTGMTIASVVVEVHEGRLVAHVWNEQDEGGDPTETIVLVRDVVAGFRRTFNDDGLDGEPLTEAGAEQHLVQLESANPV